MSDKTHETVIHSKEVIDKAIEKKEQVKKNNENVIDFEKYLPQWIDYSKIEPRDQPWLWEGVFPLETSTLLAGSGGIGKSLLLLDTIAKVTTGATFNCCGTKVTVDKGSVILMSAEDSDAIQIVPKLLAANADIKKIYGINSIITGKTQQKRFLSLKDELFIIEQKIQEIPDVKMLIIDPISYFIGELREHIQVEVCNFIQTLNDLATKYRISIILNKHLRKKSGKQTVSSVLDEVGGSAAWVNTPRQTFAIVPHPMDEDKILMINMKVNIAKRKKLAFAYKIEPETIQYNGRSFSTAKIVWQDSMEEISLEEASSQEAFIRSKAQIAHETIKLFLKENGLQRVKTVYDHCKWKKIAPRTSERALQDLIKERVILRDKTCKLPHVKLADGWDGEQ